MSAKCIALDPHRRYVQSQSWSSCCCLAVSLLTYWTRDLGAVYDISYWPVHITLWSRQMLVLGGTGLLAISVSLWWKRCLTWDVFWLVGGARHVWWCQHWNNALQHHQLRRDVLNICYVIAVQLIVLRIFPKKIATAGLSWLVVLAVQSYAAQPAWMEKWPASVVVRSRWSVHLCRPALRVAVPRRVLR